MQSALMSLLWFLHFDNFWGRGGLLGGMDGKHIEFRSRCNIDLHCIGIKICTVSFSQVSFNPAAELDPTSCREVFYFQKNLSKKH